jgi:hypothetical protein
MVTLEQTLREYEDRRELTSKEKELIKEEYGKCCKLNIANFKEDIIMQALEDKGIKMPKELVAAYIYVLSHKKTA